MTFFAQLPCVSAEDIVALRLSDAFVSLKVLLGMSLAKGLYQERVGKEVREFGVSLSELTPLCHLTRNQVVGGVRELIRRGLLARTPRPSEAAAQRRTAFYCFVGSKPFMKIPYQHLQEVGFMKQMKRWNRSSRLAMEIYLRLGAMRNYRTGQVWVTYDTLQEQLMVERAEINTAFRSLERCQAIKTVRPSAETGKFHYKIIGVDVDPRSFSYRPDARAPIQP